MYVGRETRCITKLFTTNNNLGKLLSTQTAQERDKYDYSGVYHLECSTCNKKYVGQTGRPFPFRIRFCKHYNDYKYANNRSKFAQHIIDEGHSFGPMNDMMGIMHNTKKGRMLRHIRKIPYIQ
jgi:hypothetical protein